MLAFRRLTPITYPRQLYTALAPFRALYSAFLITKA